MILNYPEATEDALRILRNGATFEWHVVPLLAFTVYIYTEEVRRRNWKEIAAGLSLFLLRWSFEIGNGLIQHISGHALWTVPTGTAFLLLIGIGVELSCLYAVAGILFIRILPADPSRRIFRINNRLLFVLGGAGAFSFFEMLLAKTPAFVWVYPWWGALSVFLTVFVPSLMLVVYSYDWQPVRQIRVLGALLAVNAGASILLGPIMHWV